jgi:Flp pilus assembly protein CpaB
MDRHGSLRSWRAVRAQIAIRRRLVVAVLTGVAVVSGLSAVRPAAPATRRVWVAARDLPGGQPLSGPDLRIERMPIPDVPHGVLPASTTLAGMLLAAPMRQGEPLTDVRILSSALLRATDESGDVAVPVRVADGPATLALVRAGNLIDVIAASDADNGGRPTTFTVVHDVRVLATPSRDPGDGADSGDPAGLLIVEATDRQAAALARASTGAELSIAVRRDP